MIGGGELPTFIESVAVTVVKIGVVRMTVTQRRVDVPVAVRLLHVGTGDVLVLMMFVVPMKMVVLERLVDVLVLVALGEMKPHAHRHQRGRDHEPCRHRLEQHDDRPDRAHERRRREVRASAGGAQHA